MHVTARPRKGGWEVSFLSGTHGRRTLSQEPLLGTEGGAGGATTAETWERALLRVCV